MSIWTVPHRINVERHKSNEYKIGREKKDVYQQFNIPTKNVTRELLK